MKQKEELATRYDIQGIVWETDTNDRFSIGLHTSKEKDTKIRYPSGAWCGVGIIFLSMHLLCRWLWSIG